MPDQPALLDHTPTITTPQGPAGGPVYAYRGATITANKPETLFRVELAGAPFNGWNGLGNLALPCSLVDHWLDHGALPPHYTVSKAGDR